MQSVSARKVEFLALRFIQALKPHGSACMLSRASVIAFIVALLMTLLLMKQCSTVFETVSVPTVFMEIKV